MNQEARTVTTRSIKSFTDLRAWQEGHKLVLQIYNLTKQFPRDELFGLVSQMRRAAVSVTSNIAEGFGRASYSDKVRFYDMAQASNTELQNQLLVARDVGHLETAKFVSVSQQSILVHKIINGLLKKSKSIRDTD